MAAVKQLTERRGPQTIVTGVTPVTTALTTAPSTITSSKAPQVPAKVQSTVSVQAVSDPKTLARIVRDLHSKMDQMHASNASVTSGAVWLQDVALKAGANYIEHRLSRVPKGILVALSDAAVLRAALPAQFDPSRYFAVTTVGAQTVSMLIF